MIMFFQVLQYLFFLLYSGRGNIKKTKQTIGNYPFSLQTDREEVEESIIKVFCKFQICSLPADVNSPSPREASRPLPAEREN